MKFKRYHFLIISIIIFSYWGAFLRPISIGNDLDYYFSGTLNDLISTPLTWREFFSGDGFGEYTISTLWNWPIIFLIASLTALGMEYSLLVKIFFLLPIILLGYYGMRKLTSFYGISSWPQTVAILFYLLNSYILLLIDGGQLGVALAYSFFPLTFFSFKNFIKDSKFSKLITAIFFIILLSFFDIRILLLFFLFIAFDGFFEILIYKQPKKILNFLLIGFITGILLFGTHAYWIIPSIYSKSPQLPLNYDRESQVTTLSFATITHALYQLQPHWFENRFGQIKPIKGEFVLIPILIFSAAILGKKSKKVAFWLVISVISIFLTKGANEPLVDMYGWLFKHVPGFSLFRDPTKFFFLSILSASILIGISSNEIGQKLAKFPKIKMAFFLLLISYLFFLARPVWLGQMTGLFSEPLYKNEYFQLAGFLSKNEFSRIVWIPKKPSLGYTGAEHPSVNALKLIEKRPFATGVKGSYETLNFLREATYAGQLLDVSGVGYLSYPPLDPKKDDMHPDSVRYFHTFLNQLSHLPWLSRVNDSSIPLLKVNEHQDRFFVTPNVWWVIGSDNLYSQSIKNDKLKLSKNAFIFSEEQVGLGQRLDELPKAKIILWNKTVLDFAASFINPDQIIFPAKTLDFSPDKTGWWKREAADLIGWRDFLQVKYGIDNQDFDMGGGWAVAEGSLSIKVSLSSKDPKPEKGDMLLVRALESSRSGQLEFYQGDLKIGQIDTKKTTNNIRWFEVGNLKDNSSVTIYSKGDINVVNALASVEPGVWYSLVSKVEEYENEGRIADFNNPNIYNSQVSVNYQKINSTKYKVTINNLQSPALLVFSQNYDLLWKLNDSKPMPVYSLLNGFRVDKDGEYWVEFESQKYVVTGFLISGLSFMTVIILLVYSKYIPRVSIMK